jgi:preprotein translocase subunit SecA
MVRENLPDLIFRTDKGKFQALIREIKARHEKGQPVLVGTVSIQKNEKLSRFLEVEGITHEVLNAKNHEREALIIAQAGRKGAVTIATNMAGRGVDIILGGSHQNQGDTLKSRCHLDESDEVRKLGGLHVIGTERHEARRIDNQLRGRSGRQGDAGSSQFFVSMEDDLMRIFGSDRIKRMMESLGIPEDQPIENKMVSRAIESAQEKIEGFHFDARKHVLEFDDVLNKQRDAIYRMRKEILFVENAEGPTSGGRSDLPKLRERIFAMLEEEITKIVEFHTASESAEEWNIEEIFEVVKAMAGLPDETHKKLKEIAAGDSSEKSSEMISFILENIKAIYAEREKIMGEGGMRNNIERAVMLRSIDILWMDHLDQMEHLRDSVRLRAYGQRDPLIEYKNEGAKLFRNLQVAIRSEIVNTIFKVGAPVKEERYQKAEEKRPEIFAGLSISNKDTVQIQSKQPQIGRNDPCPCGSGKKYKKCHGA